MEKTLFNRVQKDLQNRRERSLSGKSNCIPFNMPRFEQDLAGIEKGKYYIVTANSKVGRRFAA
jgi:hypothetical protein|tara:strand:- start:90988 stop:91176 length:189 start_codon:yes stop_codon:yes gene_type:complete